MTEQEKSEIEKTKEQREHSTIALIQNAANNNMHRTLKFSNNMTREGFLELLVTSRNGITDSQKILRFGAYDLLGGILDGAGYLLSSEEEYAKSQKEGNKGWASTFKTLDTGLESISNAIIKVTAEAIKDKETRDKVYEIASEVGSQLLEFGKDYADGKYSEMRTKHEAFLQALKDGDIEKATTFIKDEVTNALKLATGVWLAEIVKDQLYDFYKEELVPVISGERTVKEAGKRLVWSQTGLSDLIEASKAIERGEDAKAVLHATVAGVQFLCLIGTVVGVGALGKVGVNLVKGQVMKYGLSLAEKNIIKNFAVKRTESFSLKLTEKQLGKSVADDIVSKSEDIGKNLIEKELKAQENYGKEAIEKLLKENAEIKDISKWSIDEYKSFMGPNYQKQLSEHFGNLPEGIFKNGSEKELLSKFKDMPKSYFEKIAKNRYEDSLRSIYQKVSVKGIEDSFTKIFDDHLRGIARKQADEMMEALGFKDISALRVDKKLTSASSNYKLFIEAVSEEGIVSGAYRYFRLKSHTGFLRGPAAFAVREKEAMKIIEDQIFERLKKETFDKSKENFTKNIKGYTDDLIEKEIKNFELKNPATKISKEFKDELKDSTDNVFGEFFDEGFEKAARRAIATPLWSRYLRYARRLFDNDRDWLKFAGGMQTLAAVKNKISGETKDENQDLAYRLKENRKKSEGGSLEGNWSFKNDLFEELTEIDKKTRESWVNSLNSAHRKGALLGAVLNSNGESSSFMTASASSSKASI